MDYYGLLFLYYLKGLSGKSILRLFFNIEVGGTEQLLPENTSTPTTSPILADIQYPDGLRTDQYFTYHETPTTISNKARIKTIKGNTVGWNQVAPSMSSSVWVANRCTKTVSGNTFSIVGTTSTSSSFGVYIALANLKLTVNHDYLFMCVANPSRGNRIRFTFDSDIRYTTITPNQDNVYSRVVSTATEDPVVCYVDHPSSVTTSDTATIKNLMVVDLTMLNDSRITDYDSFRTYYPLDYYDFNQGTLLSFNGNGIKTVGKNLLPKGTSSVYNGITWTVNEDGTVTANGTASADSQNTITFKLPSGNYFFCGCADNSDNGANWNIYVWDTTIRARPKRWDKTTAIYNSTDVNNFQQIYIDGEHEYMLNCRVMSGKTANNTLFKPMVIVADADRTYEPHKESTTSLPISTYFPTGMKSAKTIHDELTPTKAITRIGTYTFTSTLPWVIETIGGNRKNFYVSNSQTDRPIGKPNSGNIICDGSRFKGGLTSDSGNIVCMGSTGLVQFRTPDTDLDTLEKWTSFLESNPITICYELPTPIETPITTEDANEALSLLMGKSVSSDNAKQMIDIITKGE